MEEMSNQLQRKEAYLINNGVAKLLERAKAETEGKDKDKLIQQLLDGCSASYSTLSVTCADAIFYLVVTDYLQLPKALSLLMSTLPNARNPAAAVRCMGKLLLHTLPVDSQELYKCPFALCDPCHPFIDILRQSEAAWPYVLDAIKDIMLPENLDKSRIELVYPVLQYILCNPVQANRLQICRHQLWSYLANIASKNLILMDYIWKILCGMSFYDNTFFPHAVVEFAEALQSSETTYCSSSLTVYLTMVFVQKIKNGSCTAYMTHVLISYVSLLKDQDVDDIIMIILIEAFKYCPPFHLQDLLSVCKVVLEKHNCSPLVREMVAVSLLQLIVSTSPLTKVVNDVVTELYNFIRATERINFSISVQPQCRYFHIIHSSSLTVKRAMLLTKLARHCANCPENLEMIRSMDPSLVTPLVQAILVYPSIEPNIAMESLDILVQGIQKIPDNAFSLLALLLHKLTVTTHHDLVLHILYALPQTAVDKACISLVLQSLKKLSTVSSLRPICLKQMFELWRVEDRCYPYVHDMLKSSVAGDGWAWTLARSSVVRDMCLTKPDKYGADVLPVLSDILNRSSDVDSTITACMALQGIIKLVENDVIEIESTWAILSPMCEKETRVKVFKKYCQLLELVPELEMNGEKYEQFQVHVLEYLWNIVSVMQSVEMIEATLKTISKYNVELFNLQMLPKCCQPDCAVPEDSPVCDKEEVAITKITGESWIKLLQFLAAKGVDGSMFVIALVEDEVSHLMKHVYVLPKNAKTEPNTFSYLGEQSVLGAIVRVLYRATDDSDPYLIAQCAKVLAHPYSKSFPPLSWGFLEKVKKFDCHTEYVTVLVKQVVTSKSAKEIVEDLFNPLNLQYLKNAQIVSIFNSLSTVGQIISPKRFEAFLSAHFITTIQHVTPETMSHCIFLLQCVKKSLAFKTVNEANRTTLNLAVATLFSDLSIAHEELWNAFMECCTEINYKYLSELVTPSLWQDIPSAKLQKSLALTCYLVKIAKSTITPIVQLDDFIELYAVREDNAISLDYICDVLHMLSKDGSIRKWVITLTNFIQAVAAGRSNLKFSSSPLMVQALKYLIDVFCMAVFIITGMFTVFTAHGNALDILPFALNELLHIPEWETDVGRILEWFHFISTSVSMPDPYAEAITETVLALSQKHRFSSDAQWTKFLQHVTFLNTDIIQ